MVEGTTTNQDSPKRLSSRRGKVGTVRQNFTHGRTNAVVVETRKRRIVKPGTEEVKPVFEVKKESVISPARPSSAPTDEKTEKEKGKLSTGEMDARMRALDEAKQRETEQKQKAEIEKEIAEREAVQREKEKETTEFVRKAKEIEEKEKIEKEKPQKIEETIEVPVIDETPPADPPPSAKPSARKSSGKSARDDSSEERNRQSPAKPSRVKGEENRRRTKLTLTNALDESVRARSMASIRRQREKQRRSRQQTGPREKVRREVVVPDTITIQELANRMSERSADVVKLLMQQGQMMKPGDIIDADTAQLIAEEMGHAVTRISEADVEVGLRREEDAPESLVPRPPVVTVLGHVDHGKTTLLDRIRDANVAVGEAGGITQHIGAYQIAHKDHMISFLDTPGHEAFTAMRARGAQVTDIAVVVVAADDGVMPQTIECINHAKAADVPIIIAINKIDVPGADPEKTRNDLLQHEVATEKRGGQTLEVEISAKKGEGVDSLLDAILLQTELLELKANPEGPAEGIVIEAQLDRGRGAVATVIVQRGTLKRGHIAVVGNEWGRVRAITNDQGIATQTAGPSTPVEILGLSGAPQAGDSLVIVKNEARAREIAEYRKRKAREKVIAAQTGTRPTSLEQILEKAKLQEETQEAPFVIKGDAQGSVEAIAASIGKLGGEEIKPRIVHSAVGGVSESDVMLASASNTPIIAFNVRAGKQAKELAEKINVDIRYYSIIYDLIEDVKRILSGKLAPEKRETFIGYADVREIFNVSKIGKVAGCLVTEGKVERGAGVRLLRDDVVIHEGELSTLKRFKDEVPSVQSGTECGMAFTDYQDMRVGDRIECFTVEMIERTLE